MPTLQKTQLSKAEKPSFLCGHPCVLPFATSPLGFKNLQVHVVLFLSMQDRCTASPSLLLDTAFSSCFSSPRFSDCPLCGHDQSSTSCHRNSNAPLMDLQHHRLTQRCRTAHHPLSSFLVSELETKKKKKEAIFFNKGFSLSWNQCYVSWSSYNHMLYYPKATPSKQNTSPQFRISTCSRIYRML